MTRGLLLAGYLVACAAQGPSPPAPAVRIPSAPDPAPAASRSSAEPEPQHEQSEETRQWLARRGGEACATDGSEEPCRDGLICFPRESITSTRGMCAVPATVDDLLDERQRHVYLGRIVGLRSVQVGHLTTCTEKGCGSKNPCCNSCTKRPYLAGESSGFHLGLTDGKGNRYREQADECEIKNRWSLSSWPHIIIGQLVHNAGDLRILYMVRETP